MYRQGIVFDEFAVEIPHGIQQLPAGEYPPLTGSQAIENMELRGREGQDFPPRETVRRALSRISSPICSRSGEAASDRRRRARMRDRSSLSRKGLAT